MSKTNVLVFPAGEINSVELHDALSHNVNINVFGCSSVDRHGSYIFKNYRCGLPNISDSNFIEEFNKLILEWKIQYIFPTHDTIALYLAENRDKIEASIITSPYESALICRDKKKTYELFSDCDFCPKQFADFSELPVFIKPRCGQGSKDAHLILAESDIPRDMNIFDYVVCEYLPGNEMTVDCLSDNAGNLCICLPRKRKRMLAGVCVSGETEKCTEEVYNIADTINHRIKMVGLWYFQIKQDINGKYKLLEVSTRCAGTMCLTRARGINLPLMSVYVVQGKSISAFENPFSVKMDRTLITRYAIDYSYDKVYIDYDDTIIEHNDICIPVISFLYQCKNKGVKVYLISRHEEDHSDSLDDNLRQHAISKRLFVDIIKLSFDQSKSEFISKEKSIFIDNSFKERKEVHDKLGIPVFDVEGIEVLLDWKA